MTVSADELAVLRGRVAKAQAAFDVALAARHQAQAAFRSALDAIDRATVQGNRIDDLSEARRLRVAFKAGDLRERRLESIRAFDALYGELKVALDDLSTSLGRAPPIATARPRP